MSLLVEHNCELCSIYVKMHITVLQSIKRKFLKHTYAERLIKTTTCKDALTSGPNDQSYENKLFLVK